MERKNYFEMLNLPFDPPMTIEKRFQKDFLEAFSTWKTKLEDMRKNPSSPAQKRECEAQLALHDDILRVMSDRKERLQEARRLQEKKTLLLGDIADIILSSNQDNPLITSAYLYAIQQVTGLSMKSIETVFQNKGFEIYKPVTPAILTERFMRKFEFDGIQTEVKRLSAMDNRRFSWLPKIHKDVYEVLCYYYNGTEKDIEHFQYKRTTDLCILAQTAANSLANDMSEVGHCLASIFFACQAQIFSTEENRMKYNNSLKKSQLKDLFDLIRFAPMELRRDASFAEPCIERIRRIFPEYELAVAVYNQEAGLQRNPYDLQANLIGEN